MGISHIPEKSKQIVAWYTKYKYLAESWNAFRHSLLDNAPNYVVGCVFQKRYTLPGWDSVGQGLTEHEWGILYSNVYGQLFCAVDIELS